MQNPVSRFPNEFAHSLQLLSLIFFKELNQIVTNSFWFF